jgi:hypothetical protein
MTFLCLLSPVMQRTSLDHIDIDANASILFIRILKTNKQPGILTVNV